MHTSWLLVAFATANLVGWDWNASGWDIKWFRCSIFCGLWALGRVVATLLPTCQGQFACPFSPQIPIRLCASQTWILPLKGWWMHTHVLRHRCCVIIVAFEIQIHVPDAFLCFSSFVVLFPDLSLWKVRQSVLCLLLHWKIHTSSGMSSWNNFFLSLNYSK